MAIEQYSNKNVAVLNKLNAIEEKIDKNFKYIIFRESTNQTLGTFTGIAVAYFALSFTIATIQTDDVIISILKILTPAVGFLYLGLGIYNFVTSKKRYENFMKKK